MNTEECLICGAPLEYLTQDETMECAVCHKQEASKTRCVNGHYVCSDCHVAFLCVHNSCRSQIAEALGRKLAGDVFDSFSAGTEPGSRINPDAVRLMKQLYSIDMEKSQRPKLLADIPAVDVVITMGCGVTCPNLPCKRREAWGLEDPTGKSDEAFIAVIQAIESHILALRAELARPQ